MRSLILVVLSLATALAQTRQERGKQIIDEAIAALGGPSFLGMKTRVEAGRAYSFYREELSGLSVATIYTRYREPSGTPKPDEVLTDERQSFGKNEKYGAALFMDGKGYEITFRGARPLAEERLQRYIDSTRHNIFYILRERLKEPGMIFEYSGSEIIDNVPVYGVDITDSDNRKVTVYFHRSTKLPVRQSYFRRDPKTNERSEEVTIFSKYRESGGVQWPYDVQRLRDGDRVFQIYCDSVEVNPNLPDSLFQLPSGVKILKPSK